MNRENLDQLYSNYGFRKENTHEGISLYLFEEGRYFGAEIIPLTNQFEIMEKCEEIRKQYANQGYAAIIRNVNTVDEASDELYKSFFSYKSTKERLNNRYQSFEKAQEVQNGGYRYEYIISPFLKDNNRTESNSIINEILNVIGKDGPQLAIIEAAAGYGKTCTTYEVLKKLVDEKSKSNPILTELSRNRGASIFRYILLDEIDREYPTLDSKLVKYEILNGRIPLIIDGFDELLNKSELVSESEEVFGEVEPMLDTIGKLLTKNAKIILTTRKTALFGGSQFRDWLDKWETNFEVTRFTIEVPKIRNWIGVSKVDRAKAKNVPMNYFANPVLLTYLKNLSFIAFEELLEEPDKIVEEYFFSLMKREKERQELFIDPKDQYNIFKNVAKMLVQFDISSDKRRFIKEIIEDENERILQKALRSYPGDHNIRHLSDKLINHAILDRKGVEENQIGFINDFVFGAFIGDLIKESNSDEIKDNFSAYMVELGVTAFNVQNKKSKEELWNKVESLKDRFPQSTLFSFDMNLKSRLTRNISNQQISNLNIYNIDFRGDKNICSTVFIQCTFKNCIFSVDNLKSVTFIQCKFEECTTDQFLDKGTENKEIDCKQPSSSLFYFSQKLYDTEDNKGWTGLQKEILKKLYDLEERKKRGKLLELIHSYDKSLRNRVREEVNNLNSKGFIKVNGSDAYIEINKVKEVEELIEK